MKTNRLLSKQEASNLQLSARIALEKELTDAEACQKARRDTLPAHPRFEDYRNKNAWREHMFNFLGSLVGRTVLDLGCGYHPTPIYFALAGARRVYACDVSPKAVDFIRTLAESAGVSESVVGLVCAAEQLPLADACVDVIHGEAVLHHLQVASAGPELARVLKPGGKAAFKDPLGQNPVLEFARDYLPYRWKASSKVTDKPLTFADLEKFGRSFDRCSYRGFGFSSMITAVLDGRTNSRPHQIASRLDLLLLNRFSGLQRFCRYVVTCVQK